VFGVALEELARLFFRVWKTSVELVIGVERGDVFPSRGLFRLEERALLNFEPVKLLRELFDGLPISVDLCDDLGIVAVFDLLEAMQNVYRFRPFAYKNGYLRLCFS